MVPDQDWILYGAWLTTPDDMPGPANTGSACSSTVWTPMATRASSAIRANRRRRSMTGGATGVYVDRSRTGIFNSRCHSGRPPSPTLSMPRERYRGPESTISGTPTVTILGLDTAADPNDPTGGGENDWLVRLNSTEVAIHRWRQRLQSGRGPADPRTAYQLGGRSVELPALWRRRQAARYHRHGRPGRQHGRPGAFGRGRQLPRHHRRSVYEWR